jgi:hypothetical protein
VLLIYRKETAMKTGYITTEDLIPPNGGRFMPAKTNHPEAAKATRMMRAMGDHFISTGRAQRIPLKQAFEAACQADPSISEFAKYLSATSMAAERILIK